MKRRLFTLLTPLIDLSPKLRRFAARLLASSYRSRGADPAVIDDAVARAERVPILETERLMAWGAAINHGARMPRGFRPDVELRSPAARIGALRAIEARLDRAPNIQLERQRLYLDDEASLDEASQFVRGTLARRLDENVGGATQQTLKVRQAFAVMSGLIDRLEAAGHRPFLVSGTLLGVVREGDLLEHDYDVDLGLLPGDGTADEIAAIVEATPGFVTTREDFRVLAEHGSGVGIDIFLHYERDGLFWHATEIHEWWNAPFELMTLGVRGRDFFVPADSEKYLEENYGDWSRPVAFYHMSFDTPNRVYRKNKHGVLYLYNILLTALESGDRFVAESAARELRDNFDIDITSHFNASPLLDRAR